MLVETILYISALLSFILSMYFEYKVYSNSLRVYKNNFWFNTFVMLYKYITDKQNRERIKIKLIITDLSLFIMAFIFLFIAIYIGK